MSQDYRDDERDADEREEAERRIDRIRGRDEESAAGPPGPGGGEGVYPSRARLEEEGTTPSRARFTGGEPGAYRADEPVSYEGAARAGSAGGPWRNVIIIVGGLVVLGLLIALLLAFLTGRLFAGSNAPIPLISGPTDTPVPTQTPTPTPTPTLTPTPTPTPTPTAPFLALPPLTCAYQAGVDCITYCQDPANASACEQARQLVVAEGADFDYWLACVSEGGTAPQVCMEQAWRVMQQP